MQLAAEARTHAFRCLIADDSEFARKSLAKVISTLGGSVVAEASNGREAVELYDRLRPDIVLLDITMPVQNGVETLKKIMEQDKNANVIIVSALGHKEMIWTAICLGAKSFITKPYTTEYAVMMIKTALNENRPGGGLP